MGQDFIPKTVDELFDLIEKILPGTKELQGPVVKTVKNFGPVFAESPDVLEKLLPTLKEIIAGGKDASDEKMKKWKKSLLEIGGPLLKKYFKAMKDSPIT